MNQGRGSLKASIIGTGYVGLVSGVCLAELGHDVICVDIDEDRVKSLNAGVSPIYEPNLDSILQRALDTRGIRFTADISEALEHSSIQFIAVGTPTDENGGADLKYVEQVALEIGQQMRIPQVVVLKSTVPVGTTAAVAALISQRLISRGLDPSSLLHTVSNPEFLREGHAVQDFMQPDRIVIGSDSEYALETLTELYSPLGLSDDQLILTSSQTSELIKYSANAMLAIRVSFINEIAILAEHYQADIEFISRGLGMDPRIGPHFLQAGPGFGGSCLPKDLRALIQMASEANQQLPVIEGAYKSNELQLHRLSAKVKAVLGENLADHTLAVWGVAFKAETDDAREAPSLTIIDDLIRAGAKINAVDPQVSDREIYSNFSQKSVMRFAEPLDALEDASALIIITDWSQFKSVSPKEISARMKGTLVVDGRNIFSDAQLEGSGITYLPVGKPAKLENTTYATE